MRELSKEGSSLSIIRIYDDLSSKLGKESTENLILLIEQKVNTGMENNLKLLATKEDLYKVEQKLELKFSELKTDIANTKAEIGNIKFDVLKCVITLWITNSLMILGLYLRK